MGVSKEQGSALYTPKYYIVLIIPPPNTEPFLLKPQNAFKTQAQAFRKSKCPLLRRYILRIVVVLLR